MNPGAHGLAQQPVIIVEACIQEHVIRMSKVPAQTSFLLKLITDRVPPYGNIRLKVAAAESAVASAEMPLKCVAIKMRPRSSAAAC